MRLVDFISKKPNYIMQKALIPILVSFGFLGLYAADYVYSWVQPGGMIAVDPFQKGVILGIPSLALPLISYRMHKRYPSSTVSRLLQINGGLVIVGGLVMVSITMGPSYDAIRAKLAAEWVLVLGLGVLQLILGLKSNKISSVQSMR